MRPFLLLSVLVAASLTLGQATAALAQQVPFRASGVDAVYNTSTGETWGDGHATHMGNVFGSGLAIPTADLGNGLFEWVALGYSFTAANGDQIFLTGGGTVQYIPLGGNQFYATWTGQFDVIGGTGRFANVSSEEPLSVIAVNDPFELENGLPLPGAMWTYAWTVEGTIDLGKKKK